MLSIQATALTCGRYCLRLCHYLRASRRGVKFRLECSDDGEEWQILKEAEFPFLDDVKIGLAAVNFGVTKDVEMRFEDLQIRKPTED